MNNFSYLLEFSRIQCVSICSVLIPTILVFTGLSVWRLYRQSSPYSIVASNLTSMALISLLLFHLVSWFMIGVVTPVTFILLALGLTCLSINLIILLSTTRYYLNSGEFQQIVLKSTQI